MVNCIELYWKEGDETKHAITCSNDAVSDLVKPLIKNGTKLLNIMFQFDHGSDIKWWYVAETDSTSLYWQPCTEVIVPEEYLMMRLLLAYD